MDIINLDWQRISKDIREKLLGNVYCGNCKGAVRVVDYIVENHKLGLIIKGKCKNCDESVVRVVEKE